LKDRSRDQFAVFNFSDPAALLQAQGIQLTRRTVAKYREDMGIPSTHQRRSRD
jgi:DNA-directed RNA polymerase specialized sigma54-like protein